MVAWHALFVSTYPLGTSASELDRLAFQHEVWGGVTRAFLDKAGVRAGWRALDLGAGPGFVVEDLRARVGEKGSVVALDESPRWIEHLEGVVRERGWSNVRCVRARIEEAELPAASFDIVFARWVISFVADPRAALERVAAWVKPGGYVAIQDYNHEGVSVFPESAGFVAVVRATRAMYARSGGNAWIAGRLPSLFRAVNLELVSMTPNAMCGGPESGVFRWADLFFPHFSAAMETQGLLSPEERRRFLAEWEERRSDPDAVFFSPFVVDALARKP